MNIRVTSITAVVGRGCDRLFLHTDLLEGTYPFKGAAVLTLDVARGSYVEYCAANFPGVPLKVVQV